MKLVTSTHLRGTTELSLIADIKPGLVDIAEPMAYSARLRIVLGALFEFGRIAAEEGADNPIPGPLERLRMLHFFNWSIIDRDRRLLLTVVFDGPWEPYIRSIVEHAGPFLDLIFCHCVDYAGNSCFDGYDRFAAWVRQRQIESAFLYTGAPDLTVDDVRYLREFERRGSSAAGTGGAPPLLRAPNLNQRPGAQNALAQQALGENYAKVVCALSPLRALFPLGGKPDSANDLFILSRAAELLARDTRPAELTPLLGVLPKDISAWIREIDELGPSRTHQPPVVVPLERANTIQGNIVDRYSSDDGEPSHGCLVLLRFDDSAAASAFLSAVRPWLSVHGAVADDALRAPVFLNVGLTYRGLISAGVPGAVLQQFPKEFQEGMDRRAGLLGDVGLNHPSTWERPVHNWPAPATPEAARQLTQHIELSSVDAIVILQGSVQARTDDHVFSADHPLYEEVEALSRTKGAQILHVQALRRFGTSLLGLKDGISQPVPRTNENAESRDAVALGELLLGYRNERNEVTGIPHELAHNSTFMAVRKHSMDVAGFRKACPTDALKAKVLGREPDGKPVIANARGSNDFDYSGDPDGRACPLFAHVRRANPRETRQVGDRQIRSPRVLRRGFPYGPASDGVQASSDGQGLLFMAYAASLADQFEVIQRWVNGGNSTNGLSAHPDLIAGTFPKKSGRALTFIDQGNLRQLPVPDAPLCKLEWGFYVFVPSTEALSYLAAVGRRDTTHRVRRVARLGTAVPTPALVAELQALEVSVAGETPAEAAQRLEAARTEWKRILEDGDLRGQAETIWRFVRARGGALRTPYGVLVGSRAGVLRVLDESSTFSTREYWDRMEKAFGGHYLGMDRQSGTSVCPARSVQPAPGNYQKESNLPNEYLTQIGYSEVFRRARDETKSWFGSKRGTTADLRELARTVVATVAREWFGLPDFNEMNDLDESLPTLSAPSGPSTTTPLARCPIDFQRVSQFIFHPNPTQTLEQTARERGHSIGAAADRFLSKTAGAAKPGKPGKPTLLDYLRGAKFQGDERAALLGAINGFAAPTSAACVSVLVQWAESRELWRWQGVYAGLAPGALETTPQRGLPDLDNPLVAAVLRTLTLRAIPELLHRTATGDASLCAGEEVHEGDRVVVSLASAAEDAREEGDPDYWTLLFGGDRLASTAPLHACPGQRMALGTILGVLVGTLEQQDLRRFAPFILSVAPASGNAQPAPAVVEARHGAGVVPGHPHPAELGNCPFQKGNGMVGHPEPELELAQAQVRQG